MRIIEDIIRFLTLFCRVEMAAVVATITGAIKKAGLALALLLVAFFLLLGSLGLMIAALFIGLTPYLGAHWAAMISAGASMLGFLVLLAIAAKVSKS